MRVTNVALGQKQELAEPRTLAGSRVAVGRTRAGLVFVCLAAILLGSVQITNEAYVSLHGDMPRYLMNGVYMLDLLKDRPFASPDVFVDYTQLYYARYPALSLGHHPPLLSAAEVPLFGLLGVSVWAARLVSLVSFAAAAALLYLLVVDLYGFWAALLSAALFLTSRFIVEISRAVLSEPLALALLLAAAYCLHRFAASGRRSFLIGFVAAASLSVYAKQLAIFAFPAYLLTAMATLGWRRLLRKDLVIAGLILVGLVVPLVAVSVSMSPQNVAGVVEIASTAFRESQSTLRNATTPQLIPSAWLVAAVGTLVALVRRDRRAVLFVSLAVCVLVGLLLAGRLDPPRHTVYWIPAFCAMAGSLAAGWRNPWVTRAAIAVLLVVAGVQASMLRRVSLVGAGGYEEAARFVLAANPGPTVLFSGDIDTGFFTFFVRKHDADRRLVVLRSDKVLTTSMIGALSVERRIQAPSDIYPILQRFGTRYVVVEDRPSAAVVLEWLRQELHSPRFVERARFPIETRDRRLLGTSLAVYEFIDATAPQEDAVLSMNLPIVGRSVAVKLSDLINRKHLR
jgi:hypothetical protein